MPQSIQRATPWWVAFAFTALLFGVADLVLGLWVPAPPRLPESFSASYFDRYIGSLRNEQNLIVVVGDSVLWGYKLGASQSMPALLQKRLSHFRVVNLTYEGGSTTNSEMVIRYLLARGVRPRLVIFNVNSKEFNPADSAYRRLQPSIEKASESLLTPRDRRDLTLSPPESLNEELGAFVARHWRLYRYRIDLRAAIFGVDDMASFLTAKAGRMTGYVARAEAEHRPTAERFLGTYDMTPLDESNIAFGRMNRMAEELRVARVPALAFLTPTNHTLLHTYIDVPDYDSNLKSIGQALQIRGVRILDFDKAVPAFDFIDNDHLTTLGNYRLLNLLFPAIERTL